MSAYDQIDERLERRLKEVQQLIKTAKKNYDKAVKDLNKWALTLDDDNAYDGKRLELSRSGFSDGFIFLEDGDIVYYFAQRFDYAERWLFGENAEIMREFWEMFFPYEMEVE